MSQEKKYDIFISYRREDTGQRAEHLKDLLDNDYKDRISFDRENLTGLFDVELARRIDTCVDFLLLIDEKSLVYTEKDNSDESICLYNYLATASIGDFEAKINELGPEYPLDFVRIEIARALHRRDANIIPIVPETSDKFNFAKLYLPKDIVGLKRYDAIFFSKNKDSLFKDILNKLRNHLKTPKTSKKVVSAVSQEKKYDVFISYSRKDYDEVKAFVDMLKKRIPTIDVWMDLKRITVADEFDEKIISAIDASSYVIFAVSPNSNSIGEGSSKWTKKELVYAQNTNKKVIPVLLNGAKLNSWFLFEFGRTDCIDTTDTLQVEKLIENLSFLTNKPTLEEELRREKLVRKDDDIEQAKRDALPEGEFQVGDLMYKASENSGGVTVCKPINKDVTEIHIPSQIKCGNYTYGVDAIKDYAFAFCEGLTLIIIPDSVTSIGCGAFKHCSGLTSITISNSVTRIGNEAFSCCSRLTSIAIPNSVTSIERLAFFNCSGLTSITIPNSVTSIGMGTFYSCSGLTSITIPSSVTSLGENPFASCSCLTSIFVEKGNKTYDSRENCNAIIETASNTLIAGCEKTFIPNNVTSIGNSAFRGCSVLPSITIPNSVTSIGDHAFWGCSRLTSVTIPNSITSIGFWAFRGCVALRSIRIPKSLTHIGLNAFYEHTKVIFE